MVEQLQLGETDTLIASKQAWEKALSLLAPEVNRPSFEYFKSARPIAAQNGSITIGATGELARIFLEKYKEQIKVALSSIMESDLEVAFAVVPKEPEKQKPAKVQEAKPKGGIIVPSSLPLNDKYVFDNFIVGPSNRLAHAAAQAVAKKPGEVYNPFFLYGGPGLGKTHLLQAVGHYAVANHPGLRIAYVDGEVFTAHYVSAIREHKSEDFRQRYRNIDLLLVDDIQFLAGKERTKEEFFHTFNALYQMNKQIILSSDRSPRDLNPLEERLKSRFESGLVADVAPPDLETRMAILENKAVQEQVELSASVLECIAELIPTNVRALEGALVTVLAYTSLMKMPMSADLVQEVLGRYIAEKKLTELDPDAIQRSVAQEFEVNVDDLKGSSRRKELVTPRHIAMYLCRELTNASGVAIGKAFGGRDHATVIHACRKVEQMMEDDPGLKSSVEQLCEDIRAGRA